MHDTFLWDCSDPLPLFQSYCESPRGVLFFLRGALVFLLKSHLSGLFIGLGATFDFVLNPGTDIVYLSCITRTLEVDSHWHGFMNSALSGSASVQLFWKFPSGLQGGAAPTIVSVYKEKIKKKSYQLICLFIGKAKAFQGLHNKLALRSHCPKFSSLPLEQN